MQYFLAENWIVTTLGVVVGCGLALAVGFWLSTQYQLPRLDLYYLVGGVARPLGLGPAGGLAARVARRQGVSGHGHAKPTTCNSVRLQPQAHPRRLTNDFSHFKRRGSPGKPDRTGRGR